MSKLPPRANSNGPSGKLPPPPPPPPPSRPKSAVGDRRILSDLLNKMASRLRNKRPRPPPPRPQRPLLQSGYGVPKAKPLTNKMRPNKTPHPPPPPAPQKANFQASPKVPSNLQKQQPFKPAGDTFDKVKANDGNGKDVIGFVPTGPRNNFKDTIRDVIDPPALEERKEVRDQKIRQ